MVNIAAIVAPSVVGGVCLLCVLCCCVLLLFRCIWVCCGCDQSNGEYGTELQYRSIPTDEPPSYGIVYGAGQNDPPPPYNNSLNYPIGNMSPVYTQEPPHYTHYEYSGNGNQYATYV